MKKIIFCAALLSLCAVNPVLAAAEELAPGFNACTEAAESMTDNIECATKAYQYWDKKLNANYKRHMEACDDADNPKQCKDALLKAQRLWIQYKEAMLVVIGAPDSGSMGRLEADMFAAQETKKQAKLLSVE